MTFRVSADNTECQPPSPPCTRATSAKTHEGHTSESTERNRKVRLGKWDLQACKEAGAAKAREARWVAPNKVLVSAVKGGMKVLLSKGEAMVLAGPKLQRLKTLAVLYQPSRKVLGTGHMALCKGKGDTANSWRLLLKGAPVLEVDCCLDWPTYFRKWVAVVARPRKKRCEPGVEETSCARRCALRENRAPATPRRANTRRCSGTQATACSRSEPLAEHQRPACTLPGKNFGYSRWQRNAWICEWSPAGRNVRTM